jgi:predicted house-cleaning noncanonical NTP pyrophosphatase (MazG superfamily)
MTLPVFFSSGFLSDIFYPNLTAGPLADGMLCAIFQGMDTITLTCPTCGMIIKAYPDRRQFDCWFCGTVHRVRERDLDTTLTNLAMHKVEEEIQGLATSKQVKLEELGKCINAILRLRGFSLQELLAQRHQLEKEILDLSLIIHLKEAELRKFAQVRVSSNPGD